MRVARFERPEFLGDGTSANPGHFAYEPGEHVTVSEPTQQGKTHLVYQMADVAMTQNPDLRFVSLMPKPRDPATWTWAERLDLKVVDNWPPPKTWWREKPRGYVLWPKHLKDAPKEQNRAHLASIFRKCLADQYEKGSSITLADDIYLIAVMLDLNMDCEEFWTAGGGGHAALWGTMQKPSGTIGGGSVSSFAYNSPTHLVLGFDPDKRNRQRFSEIGGVDPEIVSGVVAGLPRHQVKTPDGVKNISEKLYIHKGGPYLAQIGI